MDLECQIILVQEHKLDTPDKVRAARAEANRRGWYLCAQLAERTDKGGASGGVAILARKGIHVGPLPH